MYTNQPTHVFDEIADVIEYMDCRLSYSYALILIRINSELVLRNKKIPRTWECESHSTSIIHGRAEPAVGRKRAREEFKALGAIVTSTQSIILHSADSTSWVARWCIYYRAARCTYSGHCASHRLCSLNL